MEIKIYRKISVIPTLNIYKVLDLKRPIKGQQMTQMTPSGFLLCKLDQFLELLKKKLENSLN